MISNIRYDNIEDRREMFNIIEKYLNEKQRREFLQWCCKKVGHLGDILRPGKNSTYHEKEVYWQLMSLAYLHGLDLNVATQELLRIARLK